MPGDGEEAKAKDANGSKDELPEVNLGFAVAEAIQALVVTLVAAVASLSFVAFVGAAVLWSRFYALGLPPDQVVTAVPREYLITVGATVLTGAAVLGALAIGITYIFDWNGSPSLPTRAALLVLTGIALVPIFYYDEPSTGQWISAGVVGGVVLVASWVLAWKVNKPPVPQDEVARHASPGTTRSPADNSTFLTLIRALFEPFRRKRQASAAPSPARPPPPPVELSDAGVVRQGVVFVVGGFALWLIFGGWWVVVGYALTVLLYLCLVGVARASGHRFAPYAMALFGAVVLFAAALAVARAIKTNEVQPAVALRKDEAAPVCGIYVAESSDRLYLGRLDRDLETHDDPGHGDRGHLFWLDRESVIGWTVSGLQDQEGADVVLKELKRRVTAERRQRIEKTVETAPDEDGKLTTTTKTKVTQVPKEGSAKPACSVYGQ